MTFVLDSTVRISLIIAVALAASAALGRRSAAVRHWLLAVAIACAAATPLLQILLPSWPIGVARGPVAAPPYVRPSVVTTAVVVPTGDTTAAAIASSGDVQPARRGLDWPRLLLIVWIAGAAISLSMLVVGMWRLGRIAARATPIDRGRWPELTNAIARASGLRRSIAVLKSDHPALLVTWGLARPKIVVPAAADAWPDDRARVVLCHEVAHIHRGDWTAQLLAEALRAVYWFNPLLWIACARLRDESERACDDAVLHGGVDPAEYASHLVDLARTLTATRPAPTPALAMARPSRLEGRVSAMLNARVNRRPLTSASRTATVVALVALTVPIAAVAQNRFSSFTGTVVDQTNRFVPDATLVLTNASTTAKYEIRSDNTGRFEFVGLPAGDYNLDVQQPGFAPFKDTIAIAGGDVRRDIQLQLGTIQETITVRNGPAAPLDPERQRKAQQARDRAEALRQRVSEKCAAGSPAGEIGGNIMAPMKLTDVKPIYPDQLRTANIGGIVTLEALIGTDGSVRDVKTVSSPHPDLDSTAEEAVRQWQFSTTYLNCTPMELRMKVTVNFEPRQ